MFKHLFPLGLGIAMLLGCSSNKSEKKQPAPPPPTYTLVFFDKTASVDMSKPFVANKYNAACQQLVQDNVHQQGDKLEVYYIHENTAKARSLSVVGRANRPDLEQMNSTDREAAETSYQLTLNRERATITRQLLSKLNTTNSGASNLETNISASIDIIAKAAEQGMDVHVYYFSDMVESLQRGRDFHKTPPSSAAQASEWAKEDAKKFGDVSLGGANIKMILPFEPTSSSKENNPHVTAYWKELLEALGAGVVEEE